MNEFITQIFQYSDYSLFVLASYNPWLVFLSIAIAILASFMGFQVASQAANTSPLRKNVSIIIGSIALGGGVWSMHFIGMLALELCTPITYQIEITTISVLPSIIASWIALTLITREVIHWKELIVGGVLVGAGIGTMHYVGMAAMQMAPLLRYNLPMFGVSILVAVTLAILSLWISFGLKTTRLGWLGKNWKIAISSCVMGAAISGMHYTGMAAARFVLPPGLELSNQSNEISLLLSMIITGITVIIICLVLAANLIFSFKDKSIAAINNERRLIATMDTASDGIITIDDKGLIISVNKAVTALLGWSEAELLNKNVKIIVPHPYHVDHDQYIENYLDTKQAKIIGKGREVDAVTKSGEQIPVRLGIGHVELNNQHMFVAFISDLRDRKDMENKLRENEAKIRSLVTNIPGIAYRCLDEPGWPNLFINDEVERIIGYPASDFLLPDPKRSISDFVHPEDLKHIAKTDLRAPEGYRLEFRIIDRYNTLKWVLGYGRALKADDSEAYYLDGFIMDITDRKMMESALVKEKENAERAAASRAAFLANMSHEIRTPMNAILGFSDILLDEELSTSQRKQLNTINQSAKSLLHILNDVLDSAKLDKGKFQLEYRNFSLVEEVDAVVSTLWLQAQTKGLDINLTIDKSIQKDFNGVPDRIRQVLTNIIGNAIKFTEQGTISIDINEKTKNTLVFVVSDTGVGMTPEQLDIIFDAFAQADESMSRRFGGTGLGTTISKQLVELMGGEISAQSVFGEGSTFTFTIPLKDATSSLEKRKNISFIELPSLHILIVDDIEQNIDLLSLLLKRHQHTISVARNGEEALEAMKQESFDIVLMDIQMPVMDGITASLKRREYEQANHLPKVPIIALTASVLPQDKDSAKNAGMDGFASKPVDFQQLINEIASTLSLTNNISHEEISQPEARLKIDINKGVQLWGSKTKLFTEIIKFLDDLSNDIAGLSEALKKQDWSELQAVSHKYKGLSGNLALYRLMAVFDELETNSQNKATAESVKSIDKINEELVLVKECSLLMNSDTNTVVSNNKNTLSSLKSCLVTLHERVENNEFDESLLDNLQNFNSSYSKDVNKIIKACNDFEFEKALLNIQSLLSLIEKN